MTSPIVTYDCPLGGHHAVPGDETRVLKNGDGDFIIACSCGEQPLDEAHEPPHPTIDQFGNIDANAPDPSEWLRLDDLADAWYDVNPWEPPEDYTGTRAQRRHRVRERAKRLADDTVDYDRHAATREIRCPSCGATEGRKCQRPSGHRVRKSHQERLDRFESDGGESPTVETDQAELAGWSA